MNLSKVFLAALITGSFLACQNQSGNAPAATPSAPTKDFAAMAVAMAPTVVFEIPPDLVQDCYFNTAVVLNGQAATAFQNSTVPFGQSCVSEQRLCQNGILGGTYNYASCAVNTPASCLFDGQTITNGQSVDAYANSSAEAGQQCSVESRVCNNGVLSGSNAFSSCSVNQPAACMFNGQTLATGDSVAAYTTSTVPSGQSCSLEYRTCTDGLLSGSNPFPSCSVEAAASCLFNGASIADGQSVSAFANSTVAFGTSCESEVRVCHSGILTGSNAFASCNPGQPASCLFNGQTVAHGSAVNAFLNSTVDYGQSCSAELRICENGHLSGSYSFASCDPGQPASCLFNGQTIPDGGKVTAFASSSAGTCNSEERICSNGTLSGTNFFASCQVNAPASCLFNGQTIADHQSVNSYQSASVANGQVCQAEARTCLNGVLSGSFSASVCAVQGPVVGDDDDDDIIKICKIVVTIKRNENTCQRTNESNPHGSGKLKERYDCGKHKGWEHCDRYPGRHDCGKHLGWYKQKNSEDRGKCGHNSGWYHDNASQGSDKDKNKKK